MAIVFVRRLWPTRGHVLPDISCHLVARDRSSSWHVHKHLGMSVSCQALLSGGVVRCAPRERGTRRCTIMYAVTRWSRHIHITSLRCYASKNITSLDELERRLEEGIISQERRIERIEQLIQTTTSQKPWYLVSIVTSGLALLCAWRMVTDKQQHEVCGCHHSWNTHVD
jgi:hypothetical protein